MTYEIHTRSQKSVGSGPGKFGGPDTYVAVTATPEGVETPRYLNRSVLAKRGIKIFYFGEGYSKHSGPRSMLGRALAEARFFQENMSTYSAVRAEESRHGV